MINPAAKHGDGAPAAKDPNGRVRVGQLVSQIVANAIPFYEILFVDDGSIDGTRDLILSLSSTHSIRLVDQDRAVPGLAAAVMEGARVAQGKLLLIMDADLSHPPERISDLLGPLLNGTADMVIGSRYVEGGSTAH